jgi:hypothetical protein
MTVLARASSNLTNQLTEIQMCGVGQGEVMYMKYNRLKFGSGQAYNQSAH